MKSEAQVYAEGAWNERNTGMVPPDAIPWNHERIAWFRGELVNQYATVLGGIVPVTQDVYERDCVFTKDLIFDKLRCDADVMYPKQHVQRMRLMAVGAVPYEPPIEVCAWENPIKVQTFRVCVIGVDMPEHGDSWWISAGVHLCMDAVPSMRISLPLRCITGLDASMNLDIGTTFDLTLKVEQADVGIPKDWRPIRVENVKGPLER